MFFSFKSTSRCNLVCFNWHTCKFASLISIAALRKGRDGLSGIEQKMKFVHYFPLTQHCAVFHVFFKKLKSVAVTVVVSNKGCLVCSAATMVSFEE